MSDALDRLKKAVADQKFRVATADVREVVGEIADPSPRAKMMRSGAERAKAHATFMPDDLKALIAEAEGTGKDKPAGGGRVPHG